MLAVLIVAAGGLIFNRAHQLAPVEPAVQIAALPEIVITAKKA